MRCVILILVLTGAAVGADLFRDDFSRFPPGLLWQPIGQLNGAIQEYHYIEHRGIHTYPWRNPIVHLDSWAVSDEEGKPYIEQHLVNPDPGRTTPLFVTGDEEWGDYTVEVSVKPLSLADLAGLAFRYRTSRHYYLFALRGGDEAVLLVRNPVEKEFRNADWRLLAAARFPYGVKRYYRLRVENEGPRIRALIDGKPILGASDSELLKGEVGIMANIPARFQDFSVTASEAVQRTIRERIRKREQELSELRTVNPQPRLWKTFSTRGFGGGRNVRFGDLDGDGRLDMLIAQNIPRVRGDAFDHISCLSAVTLDGEILWQLGRPDPRNGLLTNDTPFQIHDLDGDGKNEVILVRDFQIQVLEGSSGKVLRRAWMPEAARDNKQRPYEINNGDSIAFVNLSGGKRAQEILVKDRYRWFWIFDKDLRLLWRGEGQTGHYPFPIDINRDGREEFVIGYTLWGHLRKPLWSNDKLLRDHTDAISAGSFGADPDAPPRVYICGSDEGFLVFDHQGKILKHIRLGHAQTQSVGRYRPEMPGLQIYIANFWRSPGIVTLLDADANILGQKEMTPGSSHLAAVNWRGDGQEFALLSGNVRENGMLDGHLRRVVMFPDDGHPDLAYHVADVTGDPRDEIILWDQERVWIYTQDRPEIPGPDGRIYAPRRNPTYNDSNYRAIVSLPGWAPRAAAN
jgi:rhamnogalacturonan endolyase